MFGLSDFDVSDQEGKKRVFSSPRKFTNTHLGGIMVWMTRTHRNFPVRREAHQRVRSLVGTPLTSPRHILQFVGTDICRELIETYHVDVLVNKIKSFPGERVVITDVRFPNEGDIILDDFGGMVVYVDRLNPTAENVNRHHPSETALLEWGRFTDTIYNHRDGLVFLYEEVDNFLEKHGL